MDKTDLLGFTEERIQVLTEIREELQNQGDYSMDEYTAGAIDAYDIIRMKLTD